MEILGLDETWKSTMHKSLSVVNTEKQKIAPGIL